MTENSTAYVSIYTYMVDQEGPFPGKVQLTKRIEYTVPTGLVPNEESIKGEIKVQHNVDEVDEILITFRPIKKTIF